MSLGWWTGALLVTTFIGGVAAEGDAPIQQEETSTETAHTEPQAAFDSDSIGAYMDRTAGRDRSNAQAQTSLEGSDAPGLTKILAQLLFSLVLVVGLIYGLSYGLRRLAGRNLANPNGPLKVLARHSISQKSSVYLVTAFDRFLIIGESPQGLNCLSEFTDTEENEERLRRWGWETTEEPAPSFASKGSPFAPLFQSHVTELEREIDQYREVS